MDKWKMHSQYHNRNKLISPHQHCSSEKYPVGLASGYFHRWDKLLKKAIVLFDLVVCAHCLSVHRCLEYYKVSQLLRDALVPL